MTQLLAMINYCLIVMIKRNSIDYFWDSNPSFQLMKLIIVCCFLHVLFARKHILKESTISLSSLEQKESTTINLNIALTNFSIYGWTPKKVL